MWKTVAKSLWSVWSESLVKAGIEKKKEGERQRQVLFFRCVKGNVSTEDEGMKLCVAPGAHPETGSFGRETN